MTMRKHDNDPTPYLTFLAITSRDDVLLSSKISPSLTIGAIDFFQGIFSKSFEVRSRNRPYMLDIYKQVSKFCDCIKIYIFYFGYFLEHIRNAFH